MFFFMYLILAVVSAKAASIKGNPETSLAINYNKNQRLQNEVLRKLGADSTVVPDDGTTLSMLKVPILRIATALSSEDFPTGSTLSMAEFRHRHEIKEDGDHDQQSNSTVDEYDSAAAAPPRVKNRPSHKKPGHLAKGQQQKVRLRRRQREQERKRKVAHAATKVENASTIPGAEENSLATKSVQAGDKSGDEDHLSARDPTVASDEAPVLDLKTLRKSFKARLQGRSSPKDSNVLDEDEDADSDEDVDPVDAFRSMFNEQLEMYKETEGNEDKVFSDFVIAFFLLIMLVVFGMLVYASITAVDSASRLKSSASESGRDQLIVERRKKRRRRERERRRSNHLKAQSIHMNDPDPPLI